MLSLWLTAAKGKPGQHHHHARCRTHLVDEQTEIQGDMWSQAAEQEGGPIFRGRREKLSPSLFIASPHPSLSATVKSLV